MDREPREVDEAGVTQQQDPAVVALDVHNVVSAPADRGEPNLMVVRTLVVCGWCSSDAGRSATIG